MAELPHLPIHTDALIADTTHMTAEVFGAYVRLLMAMWRHMESRTPARSSRPRERDHQHAPAARALALGIAEETYRA
jgi:uncharacterized protein YdaU (DUF1376 family)